MTRVRFAPSPTGSLHLGSALSAVANRRFADEHGGTFLLRIDDTDAARNVDGGADAIVEDLDWLGVRWDEGPVRQSERFVRHREAAHLIGEPDAEGALRFGHTTLLRAGRLADVPARERGRRSRLRDHARDPRLRPPRERRAPGGADPCARRRAARVRPPRAAARRGRDEAVEASRRVVARGSPRRRHSAGGGACVSRRAGAAAARRASRPAAAAAPVDGGARRALRRGARRAGRRSRVGGAGAPRRARPRRGARLRRRRARAGARDVAGGRAADARPVPRAGRGRCSARRRSCAS